MEQHAGRPGTAGAVLLLGPSGAGTTTLATALAGPPQGPPGRLAVATVRDGAALHLLDVPGAPDLAGERATALRAARAAVLVLSPVQGVDARTALVWESLEHLPRLVVLTQLDRPGADADEAVAVCQRVLGEQVLPLQLPLHDDDGSVGGVLDLLHLRVHEGGQTRAADPEHATLVEALREELLEAVLTGSDDEALFEDLLDGRVPGEDVLDAELAAAVVRGDVVPVLVASPRREVGLAPLRALLARVAAAAPLPLPVLLDADGEPVDSGTGPLAEALRPGLVVVHRPLDPGARLVVADRQEVWDGPAAAAGAVVGTGLDLLPGDVLADRPLRAAWGLPSPAFAVGAPDDPGLAARVAADPAARLAVEPRTGQLLLWSYGPQHAEVLLAGLPSAPVRTPPGARPVRLRVAVPAWAERAVRSDLSARGGEVLSAQGGADAPELEVAVPPAEAAAYPLAAARASGWTAVVERL